MLLKIRVTKCKIHLVIFLFRNIKLYKLDVVCCVRGITFNISFILKDLCLKILESKQNIALVVEQVYIAKSNRHHNPNFVWTDFDLKLWNHINSRMCLRKSNLYSTVFNFRLIWKKNRLKILNPLTLFLNQRIYKRNMRHWNVKSTLIKSKQKLLFAKKMHVNTTKHIKVVITLKTVLKLKSENYTPGTFD